ncbi:MAG: hypothetical protein HY834_08835 [Devosia nanyangense]|uniref:Uncharacterized protein n=1 Tax=Devosia nanyangense TaxID=1228055 RepID=A0A933L1J3_9HYPH|nr:hypothetical protein [Devosia nanyangense]
MVVMLLPMNEHSTAPLAELPPDMRPGELAAFKDAVGRCSKYLEFGSGGSTLVALRSSPQRIWSVESDPAWVAKLRVYPEVQSAEASGRLQFITPQLGTIGEYGRPLDETTRATWPTYYQAVTSTPGAADADLFFIDGRFRVACALMVVRHGSRESTILIHDFWNRPAYHSALPFLRWRKSVDTLGIFSPAEHFQADEFEAVLASHQFDRS